MTEPTAQPTNDALDDADRVPGRLVPGAKLAGPAGPYSVCPGCGDPYIGGPGCYADEDGTPYCMSTCGEDDHQPVDCTDACYNGVTIMDAEQFDQFMATIDEPDPAPVLERAAARPRRFTRDQPSPGRPPR